MVLCTIPTMVSENIPEYYQNCNTSRILILGGYDKMRESLYTHVIIWVKTILILGQYYLPY